MPVIAIIAAIMVFAVIGAVLDEKHPKAFHTVMLIVAVLLVGYACYCKYKQAEARLEQPQQTQEAEP